MPGALEGALYQSPSGSGGGGQGSAGSSVLPFALSVALWELRLGPEPETGSPPSYDPAVTWGHKRTSGCPGLRSPSKGLAKDSLDPTLCLGHAWQTPLCFRHRMMVYVSRFSEASCPTGCLLRAGEGPSTQVKRHPKARGSGQKWGWSGAGVWGLPAWKDHRPARGDPENTSAAPGPRPPCPHGERN